MTIDNSTLTTREIDVHDVQDWLDKASVAETDQLTFPNSYDNEQDTDDDTVIRLNCGTDAGSLYDLQRIQEACNQMDLFEILSRLTR